MEYTFLHGGRSMAMKILGFPVASKASIDPISPNGDVSAYLQWRY